MPTVSSQWLVCWVTELGTRYAPLPPPSLETTQQPQLSQWLRAVKPSGTAAPPQAPTPVSRKRKTQELKAVRRGPPTTTRQNDHLQSTADRRRCRYTTARQRPKKELRPRIDPQTIRLQTSFLLPVGFSSWQVLHHNQCQASPCPASEGEPCAASLSADTILSAALCMLTSHACIHTVRGKRRTWINRREKWQ